MNKRNKPNKSEKNASDSLSFGGCIGMMVGVAVGCWTDNLGLWMSICIFFGLGIGAAIDTYKKKKQ